MSAEASSCDREASVSSSSSKLSSSIDENQKGGWVTFPFMLVTTGGLMLGGAGWVSNLVVYLIKTYHVQKIDAVQIATIVNGFVNLFPVFAAILADSFLSCFTVIWIFSVTLLLGTLLLTLSTTINALKPPECSACNPTKLQFATLYAAITLAALGVGGTRSSISTMGANQFRKQKHQAIFFNWYYITSYASHVIAMTVLVYIQDNVSFKAGFIICVAANAIGLIGFLSGTRFYSCVSKPTGSPFRSLARVLVASIRKRKVPFGDLDPARFYYGEVSDSHDPPSTGLKWLNRAAIKTEDDVINRDGSIAKPWRLCSVEEVEDLKRIMKLFPVWTSGVLLLLPVVAQVSLTVLQAMAMERHVGKKFEIPPGSMTVIGLFTCTVSIAVIDRLVYPWWKKIAGKHATPLQKIGAGHVLNVLAMAASALVESKRRAEAAASSAPMSVLWLMPPLVLIGVGEAFHYPNTAQFYYQEFPAKLKNMATAMSAVLVAIAFYVGSIIVELIRKMTGWLPNNDIDKGRLDNVYWVLCALGLLNFGYFLVCASSYKYQNWGKPKNDDKLND